MNNREFGARGELMARDYLKSKGMRVLEMNYRCPIGELDIIAREGRRYVFVEVKRRMSTRFGRPGEAVNREKQRHIVRTAQFYLKAHRLEDVPVRFDVIEILPGELKHIPGAFGAPGSR